MIHLRYYRYESERLEECASVTEAIALAIKWEDGGWAFGDNVLRDGQILFPKESRPAVWARLWDEMAALAMADRGIRLPLGEEKASE